MAEAYIVAAARTAGGRKGGRLAGWHPADLAAKVLDELVDRTKVDPALVACKAFAPIYWSERDTDDTVKQILGHNAAWLAICRPSQN